MQYIKLGNSGLDVSPVCIGCMGYGDPSRGHPAWSLDEAASRDLIRHALEAGINFFDTANMYSTGSSEEFVGRAIKDLVNREAVVIATKVSASMRNGPNAVGLSRKAILTEVDHSLRRLGTDYIDLYQIHRRDQLTPWEETLEALHDVVKAGKVRYLGASSMKAWEFAKALHIQTTNGWTRFISMQHNYNLVAREEEREMIPLCADAGVGTLIYSPLARGKLARQWGTTTIRTKTEPAGAAQNPLTTESDRAIVEKLNAIAAERGVSAAQISLAWLRRNAVVAAPIVGALKTSHIDDAIASLAIAITDDEATRLEEHYTPRADGQSISTPALLHRSIEAATGFKTDAPLL